MQLLPMRTFSPIKTFGKIWVPAPIAALSAMAFCEKQNG
jgi:hypothetical protein